MTAVQIRLDRPLEQQNPRPSTTRDLLSPFDRVTVLPLLAHYVILHILCLRLRLPQPRMDLDPCWVGS
jgi:hypothetical protein